MDCAFTIDEKHIRTCRLGDIAAIIKHQRILKSLFLGSMLGKRTDHIKASSLCMYRRRFRCRTTPVRNIQCNPFHLGLGIKIAWPFPSGYSDIRCCLLCRDSHHFRTTPAKSPYIAIDDIVGLNNCHFGRFNVFVTDRNIEIQNIA